MPKKFSVKTGKHFEVGEVKVVNTGEISIRVSSCVPCVICGMLLTLVLMTAFSAIYPAKAEIFASWALGVLIKLKS